MGIDERRARERQRRREEILEAAFRVAERVGWRVFSVEQVAAEAELGRATIYSYFDSIERLVLDMAEIALGHLRVRLASSASVEESLDVPVRLAQSSPAEFELLFPQIKDPRAHMSSPELVRLQEDARALVGRLGRVAERQTGFLSEEARKRAAFLVGVSMAGATVPELKASTTLRHQFQDFCLGGEKPSGVGDGEP